MPTTNRAIRKLNRLLELDYDAIAAYEAAIDGLGDRKNRNALKVYCEDHRRHTQLLSELVIALGGQPATGSDWMRLLTVGKVQLAKLFGSDKAILLAMRVNEEVTNRRYELAIALGGIDATTLKVLEQNLQDERRHRSWISRRLRGRPTPDVSTGSSSKPAAATPRPRRRNRREAAPATGA